MRALETRPVLSLRHEVKEKGKAYFSLLVSIILQNKAVLHHSSLFLHYETSAESEIHISYVGFS